MTPREEQLLQTVDELKRENALLRQKIDLLVRRVFGGSSEQLDKNQLELLMGQVEEASLPVTPAPQNARTVPPDVPSRAEAR